MKVGIVTSSLSRTDGWGRYSFEIVQELKNHVTVKVISHTLGENAGIELHPILSSPLDIQVKLIRHLPGLVGYLKDCDVIHCISEPYAPVVAFSNILLRKPLFITAHGTYAIKPLSYLFDGWLLKFAYKQAEKIMCVSKYTEAEILKRVRLRNTHVIPNGVDYHKFHELSRIPRNVSRRRVLSVGAVKPRKGFDVSLKAFARVKKEVPDIEYYIAGDTSNKSFFNSLSGIISDYGIAEDVHFLGEISDDELDELYQSADVFLLTPKRIEDNFEGFGLVYLEAGACGKPVVASDSGGVTDAVADRITGLVVPENDVQATAEALKRLLTDDNLARELGDNGRKRAQEFSWGNIVREIINIYQEVSLEKQNA